MFVRTILAKFATVKVPVEFAFSRMSLIALSCFTSICFTIFFDMLVPASIFVTTEAKLIAETDVDSSHFLNFISEVLFYFTTFIIAANCYRCVPNILDQF